MSPGAEDMAWIWTGPLALTKDLREWRRSSEREGRTQLARRRTENIA